MIGGNEMANNAEVSTSTMKTTKKKLTKLERREEKYFWMFISPWVIGFILFIGGPILASLFFQLYGVFDYGCSCFYRP